MNETAVTHMCAQEDVNQLVEQLKSRGVPARGYHGGLSAHHRTSVQNAFMANRCRVVVATVALGMGIDKPDIRSIVHFHMPRRLAHGCFVCDSVACCL